MHIWKIGKKSCKHYKTSVDLWGNKILKQKKKITQLLTETKFLNMKYPKKSSRSSQN